MKRFSIFAIVLMFFAVTAYAFPSESVNVQGDGVLLKSSDMSDTSIQKIAHAGAYSQHQYILSRNSETAFTGMTLTTATCYNCHDIQPSKNNTRRSGGAPSFIRATLNTNSVELYKNTQLIPARLNPESFLC